MRFISISKCLIKYSFYLCCLTLSLLLLILSVALFTPTGNQFILKKVQQYEPRLNIVLSDGLILNHPTYEFIQWKDDKSTYTVTGVSYELGWRCLFNHICIDSLSLNSADIDIDSTTQDMTQNEDVSTSPFHFPMPVYLNNAVFNELNIHVAETQISVKKLRLTASAIKDKLTLSSAIEGLDIVLSGEINNNAFQMTSKNTTTFPAILKEGRLPEVNLPFTIDVNDLTLNNVRLLQPQVTLLAINHVEAQFQGQHTQLNITRLFIDLPEADVDIKGAVSLTKRYPMNFNVQLLLKELTQLKPMDLLMGQKIKINTQGDLSQLTSKASLTGLINANVLHQVDLFNDNLPTQLAIDWTDIQWPLIGDPAIKTNKGSLSISGDLSSYTVLSHTDYTLPDIAAGQLDLMGKGDLSSFSISQLVAQTLEGDIQLTGQLDWSKELNWFGTLSLNDLNLSRIMPEYPNELSGQITQSGTFQIEPIKNKSRWHFSLPNIALKGVLMERPLTLNGTITGDQKSGINVQQLVMMNAQNKVVINGRLAEKSALNIELNLPDLSHIMSTTQGQVKGNISLTGNVEAMHIESDITAAKLAYLETKIESIQFTTNTQLTATPITELQLNAQNIVMNKQHIKMLNVAISPQTTAKDKATHEMTLVAQTADASTQLSFLLSQHLKQWDLVLNKGGINSQQGVWHLNHPVNVVFNKQHVNLSAHCWSTNAPNNQNSQVCINQFTAGEQGNIDINIDHFYLASLQAFIPDTLILEGALDAIIKVKWIDKAKPEVVITMKGEALALNLMANVDKEAFTRYPVEQLAFSLKGQQQRANFSLQATSAALIDTTIVGEIFYDKKNQSNIDAQLSLALPDFNAFSVLIPQVDKLTGQLNSNLSITGALKKPMVDGEILIKDVAAHYQESPVQMTDLNAQIAIKKNRAVIDGYFFTDNKQHTTTSSSNRLIDGFIFLKETAVSALNIPQRIAELNSTNDTATNGRADFVGFFDWNKELIGNVNFKAKQMRINDYGKVDLYISPDIHLNYDKQVTLQGKIGVDKGEITVKALPEGAITVSKDVVVVDSKAKKNTADIPIMLDLTLALGQQLHVEALGLDAYLHGDLLIRKALAKPLTVNGELTFSEGTYQAFAQQLMIQNSRVIFQGSPETPYLSIEAIRDPNNIEDNVTAGVRVTGIPGELTLALFSDTAMSQQNILSYVTRGQSIKNNSTVSNNQIAAALISFGTGQTTEIMNNIGERVGIEDLSLATTGEGDQQSVGVKGTIAPGIELGYGVGVFDSFNVFSIRYKLFEKFYIEASTGLSQAIDAYYEWDRD